MKMFHSRLSIKWDNGQLADFTAQSEFEVKAEDKAAKKAMEALNHIRKTENPKASFVVVGSVTQEHKQEKRSFFDFLFKSVDN